MSDAELNEGSTWEAAMFAAHHRLANLIAIVDLNGQQALGATVDILDPGTPIDRWRAFGWDAVEVDGHDCGALRDAMTRKTSGPNVILARTTLATGRTGGSRGPRCRAQRRRAARRPPSVVWHRRGALDRHVTRGWIRLPRQPPRSRRSRRRPRSARRMPARDGDEARCGAARALPDDPLGPSARDSAGRRGDHRTKNTRGPQARFALSTTRARNTR